MDLYRLWYHRYTWNYIRNVSSSNYTILQTPGTCLVELLRWLRHTYLEQLNPPKPRDHLPQTIRSYWSWVGYRVNLINIIQKTFSIELNRRNPPPLLIPVLYQHLSTILSSPQKTGGEFQASIVGVSGYVLGKTQTILNLSLLQGALTRLQKSSKLLETWGKQNCPKGSWVVHLTRRGLPFCLSHILVQKTVRTALSSSKLIIFFWQNVTWNGAMKCNLPEKRRHHFFGTWPVVTVW